MLQSGLLAAYSEELLQQQQHSSDLTASSLSSRPAASIEELMQQIPSHFEEEKRLLEQNPSAPAAITIGDSITAFGYREDGWVNLLKQDFPSTVFVVSWQEQQPCFWVQSSCAHDEDEASGWSAAALGRVTMAADQE